MPLSYHYTSKLKMQLDVIITNKNTKAPSFSSWNQKKALQKDS